MREAASRKAATSPLAAFGHTKKLDIWHHLRPSADSDRKPAGTAGHCSEIRVSPERQPTTGTKAACRAHAGPRGDEGAEVAPMGPPKAENANTRALSRTVAKVRSAGFSRVATKANS
jgi:hypothetical protein